MTYVCIHKNALSNATKIAYVVKSTFERKLELGIEGNPKTFINTHKVK